jgi:hypothetical protein
MSKTDSRASKWPREVTKIVLSNDWIETGPVLQYVPWIKLAFRSNSYILTSDKIMYLKNNNLNKANYYSLPAISECIVEYTGQGVIKVFFCYA